MANDWVGDKNSVYKTLGSSSHSIEEREVDDFYATDPNAIKLLLELERFSDNIWECACGEGHLSKVLESNGYSVRSSDLMNRGFGEVGVDFLGMGNFEWNGDIITNPPYRYAQEFVEKALQIIPNGNKVAMFLKVQFLEGKSRKCLFVSHPPKIVYISSSRIECGKNGVFKNESAVAYAWYVWEKGFNGTTQLKWFN